MTTSELEDYNNLVAIVNEQVNLFELLDEYRKEKEQEKKKHKLFAVHSLEGKIKRMINAEIERTESNKHKQKAA